MKKSRLSNTQIVSIVKEAEAGRPVKVTLPEASPLNVPRFEGSFGDIEVQLPRSLS